MVYWFQLPTITVFQCTRPNHIQRTGAQFSPLARPLALHWDKTNTSKRLKLFWGAFTGMAVWEIFPAYMYALAMYQPPRNAHSHTISSSSIHSFPTLNGFSVFCFASTKASPSTRAVFTNIFGGGNGNEGLGLLSLSFDWQYITSVFMS